MQNATYQQHPTISKVTLNLRLYNIIRTLINYNVAFEKENAV